MKFILKHKIIFLCFSLVAIVFSFLVYPGIARNISSYFFHERLISFERYGINFYVPSFLETENELQIKNENTYQSINADSVLHLYTTDRAVNTYWYQTGGVDMMFQIFSPWRAYTENIPYSLASHIGTTSLLRTNSHLSAQDVELYIYQGSDGDGNGRGMLGSVHQGDIRFTSDTSQSVGLAFYCYDHSSGKNISSRCQQTIALLLKTVTYNPPLPKDCFSTPLFSFCFK